MLRIRFQRVGSKRQPSYRLVVMDQRQQRSGDVTDTIGHHNPRTRPSTDIVDDARALHWLSVGAQPTEAALGTLKRAGTWALFERMRKGESIEALVAEAAAIKAKAAPTSPKTKFASPISKASAE